jgi:hypothetical protein
MTKEVVLYSFLLEVIYNKNCIRLKAHKVGIVVAKATATQGQLNP